MNIGKDKGSKETILEIEVRGKRGIGWCKSTTGAVLPFKRLLQRARRQVATENNEEKIVVATPEPTDRLLPNKPGELLNTILGELQLKFDRDGNPRTAYSLRHTYICF